MSDEKQMSFKDVIVKNNKDNIINAEYSDIMQKSYIDYSMSVITARALPDVRDGLKPVQRRIIYDMSELGAVSDKAYRKSARVVGDTMGKYHPHGDSSIYGAEVVMAQDFKYGIPLIDGHGNFGSIEGDGAAAMRYTECRLEKYAEDIFLSSLKEDTVDFAPNYEETTKEPEVLPCIIPNLLISGSDGIAVGMTTNIPPHNINDVIDTAVYYLDHPDASEEELFDILKGPDFPTGGIICNKDELPKIYAEGTGKIKVRGKAVFEKGKGKEKDRLVITEIPYTMTGEGIGKFLQSVADFVEKRVLTDITDILNQTSKKGIRIVLELKKDADVEYIKSVLYKKTKLEDTFGMNMLAICNGKPEILSLSKYLKKYADFQIEIYTRKYNTLLTCAERKKEIEEGLIQAVDMIDLIIEILRGSKSINQAKKCLCYGDVKDIQFKTKASLSQAKKLNFTENQATAILEMKLSKLIGLELDTLKKDYDRIIKQITEYQRILGSHIVMKNQIKKVLKNLKSEYGKERCTVITNKKETIIQEKEEEEKEVVVLCDRFNYLHTVEKGVYERNIKDEKEFKKVIKISNKGRLLIFTDKGMMHSIDVKDIPFGKYRDKGQPVDNLCNYDSVSENIVFMTAAEKSKKYVFVSDDGMIKSVASEEFIVRKKSIQATKLNDGQKLLCVKKYKEDGYIILISDDGFVLQFRQSEIPEKKRNSIGCAGMKIKEKEKIKNAFFRRNVDENYAISKRGKRGKRYIK